MPRVGKVPQPTSVASHEECSERFIETPKVEQIEGMKVRQNLISEEHEKINYFKRRRSDLVKYLGGLLKKPINYVPPRVYPALVGVFLTDLLHVMRCILVYYSRTVRPVTEDKHVPIPMSWRSSFSQSNEENSYRKLGSVRS